MADPLVSPVGFFFLFHRLFHGLEQVTNNIFPARFLLRHEFDPIILLAGPSRHRCVPLYSSVVKPNLVLPSLHAVGVPRHTPRGPASPPRSRSLPQNGTQSQRNRNVSITHGPRHSCQIFVRNFLRQQRQSHLRPTDPHGPRCSDVLGYPSFIRHSARSEGETKNLGFPRTYFVDHGSTPGPVSAAIQDCAVHMAVDALTLGRHWDCLSTVDAFLTPPTSQGLAHSALAALESLSITMKTATQDIEILTEWQIQDSTSAPHTQGPSTSCCIL